MNAMPMSPMTPQKNKPTYSSSQHVQVYLSGAGSMRLPSPVGEDFQRGGRRLGWLLAARDREYKATGTS